MRRLFLTFVAFVVLAATATDVIPMDPTVRTGTLDNGLTYYVKHNNYPEHHADFFIAQCVGSIQEENQRGLAHFLEHMCFNGTKHFPGNSLIDYLEKNGVKFGANLNAYTSTDETVYNISNVPTGRQGLLDSCMLILSDWGHDLLLKGKDIDEERGVIEGEYRHRSGANYRLIEKSSPDVYPGCLYGSRMPIGLMSVVKNFKYKELRDYYKKWYHPSTQCVIVVGDIDPDWAVARIHELFGKVKNAGSVFLGRSCPEALGDYFAGPNHTLPTSGTARFSSPLSVEDFVKTMQFIHYTDRALAEVAEDIAALARKEGLTGHARSVLIRSEKG